jgi:hypothetical protein
MPFFYAFLIAILEFIMLAEDNIKNHVKKYIVIYLCSAKIMEYLLVKEHIIRGYVSIASFYILSITGFLVMAIKFKEAYDKYFGKNKENK